ncbi:MAG TPA: hypothetical protein VFO36_11520, partial [Nitrospiraceae bacterium]|nr:hypothetical protein [Nitrospiraceae bacterium]
MNPLSLDQAPHAVWRGDIPDLRAKIGSGPGPGALYRHFQGVTSHYLRAKGVGKSTVMAPNPSMFDGRLSQAADLVETRLSQVLADAVATPSRLKEAMAHAVLGGGKRFRPFLVIESARIFGIGP